ncbi:MAG: hypothetical protein NZM12_06665, partial [Steroidobacteraceae bacterium]|nr:hypothetical protein [Steroidobacteraceae bacterium]
NSLQAALEEPQVAALEMLQKVPHPNRHDLRLMKAPLIADGQLPSIRSRPPLAGEHTEQVLTELGYSSADIAALRTAKVI